MDTVILYSNTTQRLVIEKIEKALETKVFVDSIAFNNNTDLGNYCIVNKVIWYECHFCLLYSFC